METTATNIIGLTGRVGDVRERAAELLVSDHGFSSYALAAPLRDMLLTVDPVLEGRTRLRPMVENQGWPAVLHHPRHGLCVRRYLTQLGRGLRTQFGPEVLTDLLASRIREDFGNDLHHARLVISDIRLPQEARFVTDLGGRVVVITGTSSPEASHDFLTELPDSMVYGSVSVAGGTQRLGRQLAALLNFAPDHP